MNGIELQGGLLLSVIAIIVGIIGLFGGLIWAMPKHFLGRTETELDVLENRYFSSVVRGYLIRLLSTRLRHQEENIIERPIQISREEIERIQEIFIRRDNFRIARRNVKQARNMVFALHLSFLVVFLASIVTYFFIAIKGDMLALEIMLSAFFFVFLIASIWDYKSKLIELDEEITEINEDLMTEVSIVPEQN